MWLVEEKTWVFLILTILILEHVILETLSLLHAGMMKQDAMYYRLREPGVFLGSFESFG